MSTTSEFRSGRPGLRNSTHGSTCVASTSISCCWRAIHAVAPSLDVGQQWLGAPLCQNKQTNKMSVSLIAYHGSVHSKTPYCISYPSSSSIHILRTRPSISSPMHIRSVGSYTRWEHENISPCLGLFCCYPVFVPLPL